MSVKIFFQEYHQTVKQVGSRSGIHLYILLSPHLCFISFLYLDLYLLGDDTSISKGSCMRIKHFFVLIQIRNKGEVGTKPSSKIMFY